MRKINLPSTALTPALKVKKAWQTPTLDLLATGYVAGGLHNMSHHEAGTSKGNFYTKPDAGGPYNTVPQAQYNMYNMS